MNNVVQFIINIAGNAQQSMQNISQAAEKASGKVNGLSSAITKIRDTGLALQAMESSFGRLTGALNDCISANTMQVEAETKLAQVMRNTIDASDDEIQSIKDLATAQQKLGVIGDEVQLAGAQELSTYLGKTESIEQLLPVMNDMLAQQYGLNATQEQAVNIGAMMGKVMEGQVGALSRYGYKFDEAQEKILKYGTEEERVATLTEVIGKSVGGMNEALAATPEGKMKQTANAAGDLQERVGALVMEVKIKLLPIAEKSVEIGNRIIDFIDRNRVVLAALAAAVATVIVAVKAWIVVQNILNIIMALNPVMLIVIGIAALVAAIAWVCSKITGWGSLWEGVTGFMKYSFYTFVDAIKLYFTTCINSFMMGLDKIKEGWYKFKEAVGLGNSDKNRAALERISADIENRKQKIRSAAQDVADNGKKAVEALQGIKMGWKTADEDNDTKTMDRLQAMVRPQTATMDTMMTLVNSNNQSSGSSTGLDSDISRKTTAIATGGTRNTEINITLGNMIGSVSFSGGFDENRDDLERKLAESLYRILGMAEATAG